MRIEIEKEIEKIFNKKDYMDIFREKSYFNRKRNKILSESARGKLDSKDLFIPQVLIQNNSEFSRSGQDTKNNYKEDYLNIYTLNFSINSFVLRILTEDCSLNKGSFDQIAQPNFNASANIGISLSWISCLDSDSKSLNDSFGNILMNSDKLEIISSNCSESILAYFNISDLFFFNSSIAYSGENNSTPRKSELIIINLTGFSLKNETNIFVSTTNCIVYHPSFLNLLHIPFFTFLPNFKQSSSVSSEFSNILSSFLSNNSLLTLSAKNFLTIADQFVSDNSSISLFNSSGIDNVKLGIFESPLNSVHAVKDVKLFKPFDEKEFKNLSSVSFVVMTKEKENNNPVSFINKKFKNKTPENMNSSLSFEVVFQRFVVMRIKDNFSDFVFNNLSQKRILFTGFVNISFAFFFNNRTISHFSSNISETELNLMNLPSSNDFFISSRCSGLGGNSSTGCQSICSQNSQSSSVISPVCLYLFDMSCFKISTNAFPNNFDATSVRSSLGNCNFISINKLNKKDYINLLEANEKNT